MTTTNFHSEKDAHKASWTNEVEVKNFAFAFNAVVEEEESEEEEDARAWARQEVEQWDRWEDED